MYFYIINLFLLKLYFILLEEQNNQQKINARDRKPSGKKTRWGSDEDRVPYEQIMLMQSANEFGLQLPNAALGLATQQQKSMAPLEFYSERNVESSKSIHKSKEDFTKNVEEDISDEVKHKLILRARASNYNTN